jgi:ABC-type antimicrobial peptide transport system permease subunit
MRLRSGRDFSWKDTPDSEPVIIVNEAGARREWPGEDPIGKLAYGSGNKPARVIGVVADVRESNLEQKSSPQIYVPMTQNSDAEGATLIVRSRMEPDVLAGSVLIALRSLNPSQPATGFRPLQSFVDHSVSPRRFFVLLVTIFAALGALLAALGIYGVIAYSVTQKTQEIGVRMALGATRGRVQRAVLAQTLRLAVIGLAAGALASLGAAHLIASLLFATSPWDPAAYALMATFVMGIALLSGYFPALRASRIQPMTALRSH